MLTRRARKADEASAEAKPAEAAPAHWISPSHIDRTLARGAAQRQPDGDVLAKPPVRVLVPRAPQQALKPVLRLPAARSSTRFVPRPPVAPDAAPLRGAIAHGGGPSGQNPAPDDQTPVAARPPLIVSEAKDAAAEAKPSPAFSAELPAPAWSRPIAESAPAPAFWLLAAHGGAGATTLARTWAPAGDARGGWPAADVHPGVVVVTRTHAAGLARARKLLRQARDGKIGGAILLGLLTIPDAPGAPPPELLGLVARTEDLAPCSWRVPYLPDYRLLLPEDLPVWSPAAEPAESLDASLVAGGWEIFEAARAAYAQLD
jgi:hypothetical protein